MNAKLLLLGLVVFTIALAGCAEDDDDGEDEEAEDFTFNSGGTPVTEVPPPAGAHAPAATSGTLQR